MDCYSQHKLYFTPKRILLPLTHEFDMGEIKLEQLKTGREEKRKEKIYKHMGTTMNSQLCNSTQSGFCFA